MTAGSVPKRVLVMGGAGFLGAATTQAFVRSGAAVTALDHHEPGARRAAMLEGAALVRGDASEADVLGDLLVQTDHVVYAVGSPNPGECDRDPAGSAARTFPVLITFLEAARHHAKVPITFCSSGGTVYGETRRAPVAESAPCEPTSVYGTAKLAAEQLLRLYSRRYDLAVRILRISNAYGPTQDLSRGQGLVAALFAAATNGQALPLYGDGEVVRDYLHVSDLADAVVRLSAHPGGHTVVNVGTGQGCSMRDVLRLVEGTTGRTVPVSRLPGRPFDVPFNVLDVSRLRSMIEWRPRPLEVGVAEIWADQKSAFALARREQPAASVSGHR